MLSDFNTSNFEKMVKKLITLFLALGAAALGGWFLLAPQSDRPGKEVVLGVIAGMTGQYAAAGEGYLKGFELAREEWNKSHALQFRAVVEDDFFDSKKGLAAYQKLKSIDNPDAYAILTTFTIDVIASDVVQNGMPTALAFEQSVQAEDDTIFQVLPAARPVQKGLGEHLKSLGYKKPLAIVSSNTSVYENFFQGFKEGYGEGAVKEQIGTGTASPREIALKVQSKEPDIVVFFTAPTDGVQVAREIRRLPAGAAMPFAFDQSIQSGMGDYKKVFGDALAELEGSLVALSRNDLTDDFKTLYRAKYAEEPVFAADIGYNAFTLLATTYDNEKSGWVENMKHAKFIGADGELFFDRAGLRVPNTQFGLLEGGSVVVK